MNSELPEGQSEEHLNDEVVGRAIRGSIAAVLLIVGIGAVLWYFSRPTVEKMEGTVTQSPLPNVRELPELEVPQIQFTDVTQTAGIDFVHENGAEGEKLLPETMGGGAAFFDYDSDGDADLLCVNSMAWPWSSRKVDPQPTSMLYQNDGTGQFSNVAAGSGLEQPLYGNGVACGDFDNDGRVDIFLTAVGENRLFHNLGNGKFEDVTQKMGVSGGNQWSTGAGWFDMDNDGDLDLFVCNYIEWSREKDLYMEFTLDGQLRAYGRPADFTGAFPMLYRNDGASFTDVSAEMGVQVRNPDTGSPLAKSLGLTFFDSNQDGRLDILIANDTVQNLLFLSQPDGTYMESGAMCGVAFDNSGGARGAMGVDAACFRNSDALGIAIGNFSNEMTALYVCQTPGSSFPIFRDEAVSNGIGPVTRVELTFGILFLDADLDGRLDLFASNGHLEEDIQKVQAGHHYEQPPQLLWNCGPEYDSEFMVASEEKTGSDFAKRIVGRGATMADIDLDGDLDLFIAVSGGKPRLLRNDQQTGHHWLRFRLQGTNCNRDAIGAKVTVTLPDGTSMCRSVMPTRSYQSQVELPVMFGLGGAKSVSSAKIIWPDGTSQSIDVPAVDCEIFVKQPAE